MGLTGGIAACRVPERGLESPVGMAGELAGGGRLEACPNPDERRVWPALSNAETAFRRLQACGHRSLRQTPAAATKTTIK